MTFEDEVLFDAHRLTGMYASPERLDLVAVGDVWCRLLTSQKTVTTRPVRARRGSRCRARQAPG